MGAVVLRAIVDSLDEGVARIVVVDGDIYLVTDRGVLDAAA